MTKLSSEDALLDAALENPELAPFAMFEIDLGSMTDPTTGKLLYPELEGKYTPWWNITSNGGSMADARKADAQLAAATHRLRVENMASRVEHGLSALDTEEEAPTDEWAHFWGGDSPTEKMTWIGEE